MSDVINQTIQSVGASISSDAQKVRDTLLARGLETPLIDNGLSDEQKLAQVVPTCVV